MNGEDSLSVEVRFLKDNKDLWGTMRLTEKKNDIYANITFKDSMIRYADERFVNLKKGDTLLLPESSDTMDLLKTESIKGVYNVNKGYAVFKQVQILSESDEYYIIAEGNSYSLSNYDHIALNGDSVRDNQIVSQ